MQGLPKLLRYYVKSFKALFLHYKIYPVWPKGICTLYKTAKLEFFFFFNILRIDMRYTSKKLSGNNKGERRPPTFVVHIIFYKTLISRIYEYLWYTVRNFFIIKTLRAKKFIIPSRSFITCTWSARTTIRIKKFINWFK